MTGVDAAAAAVGAAMAAATRGVPPVMVGTVDRVDGHVVWVTGLEMEQSAIAPVSTWLDTFGDRLAAGTVTRGTRVVVAAIAAQPVQLVILGIAVSTPFASALGLAAPL